MREDMKSKLDEHIKEILSKPTITNEDYGLLKQAMAELPVEKNGWSNTMWIPLLLMLASGFGGAKE